MSLFFDASAGESFVPWSFDIYLNGLKKSTHLHCTMYMLLPLALTPSLGVTSSSQLCFQLCVNV
jgi:hypothetical protein